MNTKLLVASLIGVGSIGGAVAGGYYLSQETVSNKQPNTVTDDQKTNEVSKSDTQAKAPLRAIQPAPASPDVPKEPAPTSTKEPGTSRNEARTGDRVVTQPSVAG